MRLGKTAALHFGSQVVVSLAGFVATFLIAVLLGAEGIGKYSVAVAIGFFWLVIPANSVGMATKKRMSEGDAAAKYFGGGILINAGIAATLALLVLGSGAVLDGLTTSNEYVLALTTSEFVRVLTTYDLEIAVLAVSAVTFRTINAGLQGQKQVAQSGFLKAGERVGRTAVQAVAIVLGFAVAALILGHAVALLAAAILGLAIGRIRPALPHREQLQRLLSYAKYAWLSALRGRVFGWLDTIVLSFFVSASLIGIYEVAWGIGSLLAVVSGSISRTLFPEVSELETDNDYERIRHYLDEALAFSGIFAIPGLFGGALIGERILRFYRPEFAQGTTVLLVLVAAYIADIYATQLLSVINAVDRPDTAFRVNGVFIVLNLVLNVALIWTIGWVGAAVATATSSALRTVAGYYALEQVVGQITVPLRTIGQQVLASSIMGVVLFPVRPYVPAGRPGTLALVLFGAFVYTVSLIGVSSRVRSKLFALVGTTTERWPV